MKKIDQQAKEAYKNYFSGLRIHEFRYKWFYETFFLGVKNKKILEIGVGDGGVIELLKNKNQVYGADVSKSGVAQCKKLGIKCVLSDISSEQLPFKDKTFDYVILLEVLEHVKSPHFALEEIQRVLKKNGIFIVSTPNYRIGHEFLYPSVFQFKNLKEYYQNLGFSVIDTKLYGLCHPFHTFFKKHFYKYLNQNLEVKNDQINKNPIGKISYISSKKPFSYFKPYFLAWSFVFVCKNTNTQGAKNKFLEIANDTKKSY